MVKALLYQAWRSVQSTLAGILRNIQSDKGSYSWYLDHIASQYNQTKLTQQLFVDYCQRHKGAPLSRFYFAHIGNGGADGVLLYLLANAGISQGTIVDFGAGDGLYGNSGNLVLYHGFKAWLFDGDSDSLARGRKVHEALGVKPTPVYAAEMLTVENLPALLNKYKVPQDIDVLSIDIDSIDLWLLQALPIRPKIILLEFNNLWGPGESYSVPYAPGFRRELGEFLYGSASLDAFVKVLKPKGYKLVGIDKSGFDAFFVQDDEFFAFVPEQSTAIIYDQSAVWKQTHLRSIHHAIRQKPWQSF
jgi:hypothetical protein